LLIEFVRFRRFRYIVCCIRLDESFHLTDMKLVLTDCTRHVFTDFENERCSSNKRRNIFRIGSQGKVTILIHWGRTCKYKVMSCSFQHQAWYLVEVIRDQVDGSLTKCFPGC